MATTIQQTSAVHTTHQARKSKAHGSVTKFVAGKADKALGPKTGNLVEIHKHNYASLTALKGQERLNALADLRQNHADDYKAMLADVRAGKVDDKDFKVGIGVDQLKGSEFAKTPEGQEIISHLEQQYANGKIKTASRAEVGGLGKTDHVDRNATITIADDMLNSPEGSSAILAHEGMHSQRYTNGTTKSPLQEETDGNMITGRVWSGFGSDKYNSKSTPMGSDLDITASYYVAGDDSKMKGHVAGRYAHDFVEKGQWGQAEKTLREYLNDNSRNNGQTVKNANDEDLQNLAQATHEVADHNQKDWFRQQAAWLDKQVEKRQAE